MTTAPTAKLPAAYWTYLGGVSATALGDAIVYVALPFVALGTATGAGTTGAVGGVVLAGSLPRFLGPVLGGVSDRTSPRTLFGLTSALRALAVAGVGLMALGGTVPLAVLLALAFLNGLLSTLAYAAGSAFAPRVVAPDALARANSLGSAALMGAPLLGYGLGGALLHALGHGGTLLVSVPLILGLALAAWFLPPLPAAQAGKRLSLRADLKVGLGVICASPLLLAMLALSFALNVALNVINVRAPIHMQAAGRGPADYAVFEMLISGGVLLGIALVAPLGSRLPLDTLIGAGRWVLVAGVTGFTLREVGLWWASAAVFGLGLGLIEVAAVTRAQGLVPEGLRGRTIGAFLGINAFGLSLGAALAAWAVPTPALMLGLLAALAPLTLTWPWAVRRQRRLDAPHPTFTTAR